MLVGLVLCTPSFSQEKVETAPCSSEILIKGQEKGWYKLSPKEMPAYFIQKIKCNRAKRPSFKEQISRGGQNIKSSRPMVGWTSTHASIVTLTISIYYIQRMVK